MSLTRSGQQSNLEHMTWIQTASGVAFDLLHPRPSHVRLGDIAHALARLPRFGGHAAGRLHPSVAEHSLRCARYVIREAPQHPRAAWCALMHDAHEAYVGDLTSPLKRALRAVAAEVMGSVHPDNVISSFDRLEFGVRNAVATHLCSTPPDDDIRSIVERADLLDLSAEKAELLGVCDRPWDEEPLPSAHGLEVPSGSRDVVAIEVEWLSLAGYLAPTADLQREAAEALVASHRRYS